MIDFAHSVCGVMGFFSLRLLEEIGRVEAALGSEMARATIFVLSYPELAPFELMQDEREQG